MVGTLIRSKLFKGKSSGQSQKVGQMVNSASFGQVVNPYTEYNYKNGLWDHIGDAFGFRTNQDKLREEMALKANEFNAQMQIADAQNEYNSPSSQVERARAAGINPELAGVENIGGAAPGGVDSAAISAALDPSTNGSTAMAVGQAAIGAFTNGLSLLSGIESLKGLRIQNAEKETGLLNKVFSLGRERAIKGDVSSYELSYDDYRDAYGLRNNSRTKHLYEVYRNGFREGIESASGISERAKYRVQGTKGAGDIAALSESGLLSPDTIEDYAKYAGQFMREIQYLSSRLEWLKMAASAEDSRSMLEYYGNIDRGLEANAANEQNEYARRSYSSMNEQGVPEREAAAAGSNADLARAINSIQARIAKESARVVNSAYDKNAILGFLMSMFVGDVKAPFQSALSGVGKLAGAIVK